MKPQAAAKGAKSVKAAKSTKMTKAANGTKAKRVAKGGAAVKAPSASTEVRRKKKAPTEVNGFAVGDHVVYPAHGVGRITGIDERTVGDQTLQMFVVAFEKDKMTLLVPTDKVDSAGMRRLSSRETMDAAISTLRGARAHAPGHVEPPGPGVRGEAQLRRSGVDRGGRAGPSSQCRPT